MSAKRLDSQCSCDNSSYEEGWQLEPKKQCGAGGPDCKCQITDHVWIEYLYFRAYRQTACTNLDANFNNMVATVPFGVL